MQFLSRQQSFGRSQVREVVKTPDELGAEAVGSSDSKSLLVEFGREFDVDMSDLHLDQRVTAELPFVPRLWLFWKTFTPSKLEDKGDNKMVPITVLDLYKAAKAKKWPNFQISEEE